MRFSPRKPSFSPFRRKCQIANRRTSLDVTTLLHPENCRVFFFFFYTFWFVFCCLFFILFRDTRVPCAAKIRRDSRSRVSLWPSVTVYSFRSYFVPVALKKSQSIRDKYAYILDDGERELRPIPICRDSCARTLINIYLRYFWLGINAFRTFLISAIRIVVWSVNINNIYLILRFFESNRFTRYIIKATNVLFFALKCNYSPLMNDVVWRIIQLVRIIELITHISSRESAWTPQFYETEFKGRKLPRYMVP